MRIGILFSWHKSLKYLDKDSLLPFIEGNQNNIIAIIKQAKESGASYILPSFGVTLRDRQGKYYYDKLDKLFPGVREEYEIP